MAARILIFFKNYSQFSSTYFIKTWCCKCHPAETLQKQSVIQEAVLLRSGQEVDITPCLMQKSNAWKPIGHHGHTSLYFCLSTGTWDCGEISSFTLKALVLPRWALLNLDIVMQQLIPKGSIFHRHPHKTWIWDVTAHLNCFREGQCDIINLKAQVKGHIRCYEMQYFPICIKCITHILYFVIQRILQCINIVIYHCTMLVQCYLWKRK